MRPTEEINNKFKGADPGDITRWALEQAKRPVITSSFGPYTGAILHMVTRLMPEIPVIWCDTGYNTAYTYRHVEECRRLFGLNLKTYFPSQTTAHLEAELGGLPQVDDPKHKEFTRRVKLEPFERAMNDINPDVWFTNIRKGQTALRDTLGMVSYTNEGILKISPFYHWTDEELDAYLKEFDLPNEFRYYDPTKVYEHRECGIHLI